MICPRCKDKFFSRNYSTKALHKTVTCPLCNHRFPAPLRADLRRDVKDLLTDCLFDDDVYKNSNTIERVQWLVNKLRSTYGRCDD